MLTLTYGQLRDSNFNRAMEKMANFSGFKSPKVAYNVAKINRRYLDEIEVSQGIFQKMVDQYAKKTEDGKLEPHKGVPGTFSIPEDTQAEWDAKLKEFQSIEWTIDRPRVNFDDLADVKLTPAEIMALDPLLAVLEDASVK